MSLKHFWEQKTLEQLSDQEWESLCDGCGRCCLQKLQCADSDEIFYTELACKQLNLNTVRCCDYANRESKVESCVELRSLQNHEWDFMPTTCAYRLLKEGQGLMPWHPLIVGNDKLMQEQGISVKGQAINESEVAEEDYEEHIVTWVYC